MKSTSQLGHEFELRPRFEIELPYTNKKAIEIFKNAKAKQKKFVIHQVDDHIFIKLPTTKQHFWSPQLDLEIIEINDTSSLLKGLYGPKPGVWTLFMFIHFVVATLFIGIGIWLYSNVSLERPFAVQLFLLALLLVLWFVLYFAGRMGKSAGRKEMLQLNAFIIQILEL